MPLTRRESLQAAMALGVASLVPLPGWAAPLHPEVAAFTGGAVPEEGGIVLDLPETSEDPANVALSVAAEGAREILIIAPANPAPEVLRVVFGAGAVPQLGTRIRLAGPQTVLAVARLSDGRFVQAAASIHVDEGLCAA